MFRSIMVPLDGSTLAEQALATAKAIALRTLATIHIVNVRTSVPTLLMDEGEEPEQAYLRLMAEDLDLAGVDVRHAVLQDELAPLLPSNQPTRATAEALRHYIVTHGIELVVMSSHGRGGIRRAWLGSVADALLRQSPAHVLVIRPRRVATTTHALPMRRVLVPLDGSPLAEAAIAPAVSLAKLHAGHVILTRCIELARAPVNPDMQWILPPMADIIEQERAAAAAYLEAVAARIDNASVTVETDVVMGSAAPGILDVARRHEVDVIVMATRGAGGARRLLLGSVADKVMRTAAVPVLAVHSDSG